MTIERRFSPRASAPVSIERRADGPAMIVGYASVFYDGTPETEYQLWDGYVERIMPGAFDRAIREDDVRGLFNHDPDHLLGRTLAETLRLSVDQRGLRYEIEPPDTQLGRDLVASIERGDLTGSSFAFTVTDEVWRVVEEVHIREIEGVRLYDVGPVTYPAYEATTTGLRSELEARCAAAQPKIPRDKAAIARRARLVEASERLGEPLTGCEAG